MVSALASSSVTFPRNVSVKVLVSDWDLLHSKENSDATDYSSNERVNVTISYLIPLFFFTKTSSG